MPARIPIGIAMTAATTMMITLPSKALAMPPPASPTGLGTFTRKCQLILVIPALMMKTNIAISGTTQAKERMIVNNWNPRLLPILYFTLPISIPHSLMNKNQLDIFHSNYPSFIRKTIDDLLSDHIDHDRDQEQHQAEFDMRGQV